jgi:hypothetical protein
MLSKNVLFNANKHVFHCENSLRTLFCGQPSYFYVLFIIKKLHGFSPLANHSNINYTLLSIEKVTRVQQRGKEKSIQH